MTTEIQIRGAGPVGLACALFLARHWPDPSAIEITTAGHAVPGLAHRPLAISAGSRRLIERVAQFPVESGQITTVEVALSDHLGRVRIPAQDLRCARLGNVVRHGVLVECLEAALADSGVRRVVREPNADLQSEPGILLVHADGDPGAEADVRDFGQSALLAEVRLTGWTQGKALELFTPEGPLAILPLPEPHRWALVWCAPDAVTQQRIQAHAETPNEALTEALSGALKGALGTGIKVHEIEHCQVMPLRRRTREKLIDPDPSRPQVWIGNAAQTLHPVAGQGLNLGLRDAHELAQQLSHWRLMGGGNLALAHRTNLQGLDHPLRQYERARRNDRATTVSITDTLATIFMATALAPMQSVALAALDLNPALRRALARTFAQ
jgi:2-octaprenyl-6-methoxyphenol hydroxylase